MMRRLKRLFARKSRPDFGYSQTVLHIPELAGIAVQLEELRKTIAVGMTEAVRQQAITNAKLESIASEMWR